MADFLDTSFMISFVKETPPENYKLMNIKQKLMASAYEGGERTLQAGDSDIKLVDNVTNFYIVSNKPIMITLSDGTVFEKMNQFAYSGETPISVSVSNRDNLTVKVTYAAGLKTK